MALPKSLFQIANTTILEREGVLMLAPIYGLLFNVLYLALTRVRVKIFYRIYHSEYPDDMQAIIDHQLAPGWKMLITFS